MQAFTVLVRSPKQSNFKTHLWLARCSSNSLLQVRKNLFCNDVSNLKFEFLLSGMACLRSTDIQEMNDIQLSTLNRYGQLMDLSKSYRNKEKVKVFRLWPTRDFALESNFGVNTYLQD